MSNIFIGLKKTCLGVLDTGRGEHDNDDETGLKEEGGIQNLNYSSTFVCCSFINTYLLQSFLLKYFSMYRQMYL